MKRSKKTHYALRVLAKLAIHSGAGPVQSRGSARSETIPDTTLDLSDRLAARVSVASIGPRGGGA